MRSAATDGPGKPGPALGICGLDRHTMSNRHGFPAPTVPHPQSGLGPAYRVTPGPGPWTLAPGLRIAQACAMQAWLGPGRRAVVLLALAVAGLAGGLWARLAGADQLGDRILTLTVAAGLVPLAVSVARDLARREPGVDVIALLAMAGALALGGAGRRGDRRDAGLGPPAGDLRRRPGRGASCAPCWSGPRGWCIATRTAGWPHRRSGRCVQAIGCWSSRARSCPSTGWSRPPRSWTSRP